ncbi:MAG: response regulator [Pseudomonadota bacterium]
MNARICLVEDEAMLLEMTQADLEDLGLRVFPAVSCDEAWQAISSHMQFDVLVTDIRTPGERDGWELACSARALLPGLAVVYVSGFTAEKPKPVPGSIFLSKPYRLTELEHALRRLGVI